MALTNEQIVLIDQIITQGYATKTAPILAGRVEITFHSMTAGSQLDVESYMKNVEGGQAFVIHTYSIKLLAQVLKRYHHVGHDPIIFTSPAEAETFLKNCPSTIVDALIAAQGAFEKELQALAKAENLEENFTPTPSSESEPK